MERLSSGLRINTAGDDPAGLAVSEHMKAKERSRRVAIRNIQDGISALQIADGGLNVIADILIRMRELALQAANETYSDEQRSLLNMELRDLIDGHEHVTTQTKFNGRYLLRGPLYDVVFMIDTSGSMGGEIAQVQAAVDDFYREFADAGISVQFGLVDSGHDDVDLTDTLSDIGDGTFAAELAAMRPNSRGQDPYSVLYNATGLNDIPGDDEPDALNFRTNSTKRIIYITDTHREVAVPGIDPSEANLGAALAANDFTVDFICNLARAWFFDGIAAATGGALHSLGDATGSNIPDALDAIAEQIRDELGEGEAAIEIQAGPSESERIALRIPMNMTPSTMGLEFADISTIEGAREALGLVDAALDKLAEGRGKVGADHHALETALETQWEHLESDVATKNRITDANVAEEVSEAARSRILVQTGVAVKAQIDKINSDNAISLVQSGYVRVEKP